MESYKTGRIKSDFKCDVCNSIVPKNETHLLIIETDGVYTVLKKLCRHCSMEKLDAVRAEMNTLERKIFGEEVIA